jgi:two-component system, NarL family, response regulator YdfI
MTSLGKNGSGSVRVLLASASAVRRAGLEALVKSDLSLTLAGSLSNPMAVSERIRELQPDVALIDLEHGSSLVLTERLSFPAVILADDPGPNWTAQALRLGVKAILHRDTRPEEIRFAIQAAHSGLVVLSSAISQKMAERVPFGSPRNDALVEELTRRELEVLAMLAEGMGNRQIADRLGLSNHTIKFHIASILDKLGASTRTEAVTVGLRMGLILL